MAGIYRRIGLAEDDPGPVEGLLGTVHEHGDQRSPGAYADHCHAALGVGRQTVHIANAVVDGGALREDQQVVAGSDGLHSSLDGLDIRASRLTGKAPSRRRIQARIGFLKRSTLAMMWSR